MKYKFKVCGMRDPLNIKELSELAPDYMGFIFYRDSKRFAGDLNIADLAGLPEGIKKTGVFVDEELEEVLLTKERYHLHALQLHGAETPIYCAALKNRLSDDTILIKAFGIDSSFNFDVLLAYQGIVDFFLFDTQTEGHGGSGKTFDWTLLKNYVLNVPYFLSGGIGPEHVPVLNKIEDDRFYAIDVNSRFELEPALKDIDLLKDFKVRL